MDNAKKMAFVASMAKKALAHMEREPETAPMMKQMSPDKKMAFVSKMTKHGLQHFDDGGTVLGGPSNLANGTGVATNPNTGILGTVGGVLGLNNNFQAGAANIQQGTNTNQLNNAYTGAQTGLTAAQNLQGTLAPQAETAVQNQNTLAGQYAGEALGQGPNPAEAELAQATGQNVANQAALMAGQRGAGSNVGLIARQAAQQGAQTQQQAAGQEATLEAQQQLAAQNAEANLANTQIGQTGQATTGLNTAEQNEQGVLQGANTAANNAAVSQQGNINSTNAATAAANQNMFGNVLGGIGSAVGSVGAIASMFAKGGEVGKDGMPSHVKLAEMNAHSLKMHSPEMMASGGQLPGNPLLVQQGGGGSAAWGGNYTGAGSGGAGSPTMGGAVALPEDEESFSDDVNALTSGTKKPTGQPGMTGAGDFITPDSSVKEGMQSATGGLSDIGMLAAFGGKICPGPHKSHVMNYLASGGATSKVPAMVSPGEIYLSPEKVKLVIEKGANPMKIGQTVPGKAKVKGDSYKNDTVPVDLDQGGVMIDRKTVKTRDPAKMELFVHRALYKQKAGKT